MEKGKLKKPRPINGTRFKSINKFSLLESSKMVDTLQISDSCSPFIVYWRFCWRKIEQRIRLNITKYCFRTHWEMKQRETLTNEQARERIAMDCSCHEHARKLQQENEFHKVVPGLSPSSRILRTVAAVVLTFWTSPVDYFLLDA